MFGTHKGGTTKSSPFLKNSDVFSSEDPDKVFTDLYEIGHGNFGAVYYVSEIIENAI